MKKRPIRTTKRVETESPAQLFAAADTLSLYCELRRALASVDSMMRGLLDSTDRHGRLQVIAGQLQTAREVVKRWIETEEALTK